MSALLNCPFCGKPPRRFRFSSGDVARCENCGTTAMEADRWNTRDSALERENAELRRIVEDAPHEVGCEVFGIYGGTPARPQKPYGACTCFKSKLPAK